MAAGANNPVLVSNHVYIDTGIQALNVVARSEEPQINAGICYHDVIAVPGYGDPDALAVRELDDVAVPAYGVFCSHLVADGEEFVVVHLPGL